MSRVMYFDCFAGAAGDMVLGAFLDAGLPLEALQSALGSLGVGHTLDARRVLRAGLSATHAVVGNGRGSHQHHHDHRTLDEISHLINSSALSASGKTRAISLFERLGDVEAAIHQTTRDRVHLHEVGALDSIIDIVGAVYAFEWFGIDDVVASPLNVGSGTVQIAHGTFPVPAPATLRLLTGVPVYSSGVESELVTPTGALLIAAYAQAFGPMPSMTVDRIGYGAGTRDPKDRPNALRLVIGDRTERASSDPGLESILKIECEIDDMNPQLFGPAVDRLHEAGALDVFLTAVQMKKGRPGTLVTVLAPVERRTAITDVLFRDTTTIGVRFEHVSRERLDRRWVDVAVHGGNVRIKVAGRGETVLNATPEFDDCVRVAEATGQPIKTVQAEAMRAWLSSQPSRQSSH